jgi:hypothetical protein
MSIASPSPSGTPARRDVNRQPRSGRGSVHEGGRPAERPHGAISNRQPLPRRNARTARFPIASPSPGGTPARRDFQSPAPPPAERPRGAISNRQPLPRRNARTARCQSPAPPPAERPCGAMAIASPSPSGTPARRDVNRQPRSGRGSVHEGGRPAERPHGAISNRQPLPRRNARTARFPIASPSPGGTPARRDFQSPAPPPAERPHGAMSIASPSPGGTPARRDVNRQPLPRRNARTARCQSPAPPPAERPHGAMSIASPSPGGTPVRRDVNRQPLP